MKRILLLLLTMVALKSEAQLYNNEWIDYSKTYYKFKIGSTGLCRISQSTIATLGLGATNADHFQLWRNGQQVPIYTSVQNAPLGSGDYIEFWGEMNDGKLDKDMYRLPDYQLNDKWSLQTDSAAFFLTVNTAGGNLHLMPATNNVAGNVLSPEPFFMHTAGIYYKNRMNPGRSEIVGTSYTYSSSYDYGEGWSTGDIGTGATLPLNLPNLFVYTGVGAPDPSIKINAAGNAVFGRYFKVNLNADSIWGQEMNYYDYSKIDIPITIAQISSNTANIDIINKCASANDRMIVATTHLLYPRLFNFGGASNFSFELPANTAGNYLEIAGFNYSGPAPVLYDLTNGKRYVVDITNPSLLKIALLPSAVDRKLILINEGGVFSTITSFQQRNFVNYGLAANQGNYLIITNAALTAASGPGDPTEDYRAYRNSAAGGSYNSKVYVIDQLTDQFAFGIKMHPLSIRNFLRWARATYSAPIKNVLLIGKGVAYTAFYASQSNVNMDKLELVPTFGYPASDILLSAVGSSSVPLTPIGRLSAVSKDEVTAYLNKVKQYEQVENVSSPLIADMAWKKNVIHVTGASDDITTDILLTALNGHKEIIEDTLYGGNVYTFTKTSSYAVQQFSSSLLTSLFNNGHSLLTYFGHSSASTLEFSLENPQNYDNPGKYPVFIVMGCNAGNFYGFSPIRLSTKETISEKYIFEPNKGSIAFFASTFLGIVHYLDIYNTFMYEGISRTHYGGTLGEIMDNAINKVFGITTEDDFYARFQCEQFTLHGDPAVRMYNFAKPDYAIESQLIKTSPATITVADASFQVKASFMNLGKAPNKTFVVEMKRTFPDRTFEIRRDTVKAPDFMDSLTYTLPIVATRDKGLNTITITVDVDNEVDEKYETNNSVSKDIFIYEDEARPIFPYNFAIVNQQNTKLYASSANAFAVMRDYIMEMDTTELFNSAFKIIRTTSTTGGVIEFNPGVTYTDNKVYYWRVAPKPVTTDTVWNKYSFVFIANHPKGFNQSHFYQETKSNAERISIDSTSRDWKYRKILKNLFVRQGSYSTSGATQPLNLGVSLDGTFLFGFMSWFQSVIFNVFDPNTFKTMKNQIITPGVSVPNALGQGLYGSAASQNPSQATPFLDNFEYRFTDSTWRRKAMQFMRDAVPNGSYVIVRSFLLDSTVFGSAPNYPQKFAADWAQDEAVYGPGQSFYSYLKNIAGFADIDSFNRSRNWAFIYKKGDPSFTPKWVFTEGTYDNVTLSVDCPSTDSLGFITSPLFGPSKGWKELQWRGHSVDANPGDNPLVSVIGVTYAGAETSLISNLNISQQTVDISSIDSKQYPFLKLKMRNIDSIHYTPYQLDSWRVIYDPAPEGGVNPDVTFRFKDTVEVGEPADFKMSFKNISDIDFDSLRVKLIAIDHDNVPHVLINEKKKPLIVGDTVQIFHTMQTTGFPGSNQLYFEFNPNDDQPEQQHFNNLAYRSLYVKGDSLNPLLDVTFDGVHILNRDIVSSRPDILIKLKDEAKWLRLNDSSLTTIKLKYPDGNTRQFYFDGNDTLKFIPAGQSTTADNLATINFNPALFQDGDYELTVNAKDRSDNMAGVGYRVAFQVINKPMISNMLNYPNPFTTSTAFVFTLTGSQVPQNIRIQILTITGKVVREITKDELGPLHIGRNITEFKWDGTDQYGQKLANGIYLYRVITNLNGNSLDKYKSSSDNTDKFFNNGYGKMYLMR
ncbi:MAG: C25 family cysteine peptidase [Chitinophagaceae bacterium]